MYKNNGKVATKTEPVFKLMAEMIFLSATKPNIIRAGMFTMPIKSEIVKFFFSFKSTMFQSNTYQLYLLKMKP